MYLNLVPNFYKDAPKSVHLCSFPKYDESKVDIELENGEYKSIRIDFKVGEDI